MPAQKVSSPKQLKDLRKISLTSEYSLGFEGLIKDWILEDISPSIDSGQYGNQKGTSTEHLLVNLMDRILKFIDQNPNRSAVIASMLDWSSAFDRQDPTLAIQKFLQVKDRFNNTYSNTYNYKLPGGGPQGTLVGLIEYFVQSNDNAICVEPDVRFKYVDDLTLLELVLLASLLTEFSFRQHVGSDIGIDEYYVPPTSLKTQDNVNQIADWTKENKMKLNKDKRSYMVFSRSNTEFSTIITMNGKTLDRVEEV